EYVYAFTLTKTSIKHLVVIVQENVSFDHYFATYPKAMNTGISLKFLPDPKTPSVNGLSLALLTKNTNRLHGLPSNPYLIGPNQLRTCDVSHAYDVEQNETNGGLMNNFVSPSHPRSYGEKGLRCDPKQALGYFDGNTVTAIWNYAQHFAISDNYYGATFGPSTPGHINLISGQTHGATPYNAKLPSGGFKYDAVVNGTLIANLDPK